MRPRREEAIIARPARSRRNRRAPARAAPPAGPGAALLLFAAFLGAALLVYRPALRGPFVSDDLHYLLHNPYVHALGPENLLAILDPTGPATVAVVNYTPVHLLLHATAWQLFGDEPLGHHVLNVVLHALASALLVALLRRSGIPPLAALLGGAFFLLHPANVEAVAWVSQLKSSSAMVLALASLLAFPRRPGVGTGLFALALLAKPTAAFALPVAALLAWSDRRTPWRWLALCALLLAAYAAVEFTAHRRSGAADPVLYETPAVLVRTVTALAGRYLAMAATGWGVSAFHEPEPVRSAWDPWWLGSLLALALLGWRAAVALRRRSREAAWWAWALASFAPISQIFPFLYPMADRYLYFVLPGLIGGALLAGREALERFAPAERRPTIGRVCAAAGLAALAIFAPKSASRAAIWRSPATLLADAAANYPQGVSAHLLRAKRAAQFGDVDTAVAAIRAAADRGYNRFQQLDDDPALAPVREHPKFRAVVNEIAARRIAAFARKRDPTQGELRTVARAYAVRGELEEAVAVLERALEVGGPRDAETRADLAELRRYLPRR